MKDQKSLDLYEAYQSIYSSPDNINELNLGQLGGAIEKAADTYVKPTLQAVGAQKGRQKMGGLPILGDIGARAGSQSAGKLYDTGKSQIKKGDISGAIKTGQSALSMLRNSYEVDTFDIVLEYLVSEGFAETNEAALAIMANMSEGWKQSIVETVAGNAPGMPALGNLGNTVRKLAPVVTSAAKQLLSKTSSGGYSTRPGDGKPYKDGPLWDGPETPVKKPIPQQRKPQPSQAPMRDEPLW